MLFLINYECIFLDYIMYGLHAVLSMLLLILKKYPKRIFQLQPILLICTTELNEEVLQWGETVIFRAQIRLFRHKFF